MNIPIQQPKTCTCVTHNRGAAAQRIASLEEDIRTSQAHQRHHIREKQKAWAKVMTYTRLEDDLEFKNLLSRLLIEERVVSRMTDSQVEAHEEIRALRALHAL
jgi:hypothetical protein